MTRLRRVNQINDYFNGPETLARPALTHASSCPYPVRDRSSLCLQVDRAVMNRKLSLFAALRPAASLVIPRPMRVSRWRVRCIGSRRRWYAVRWRPRDSTWAARAPGSAAARVVSRRAPQFWSCKSRDGVEHQFCHHLGNGSGLRAVDVDQCRPAKRA